MAAVDPVVSSMVTSVLIWFLLGLVAAEAGRRVKSFIRRRRAQEL
jgi:predicted cobalt transporter CbtA